jgi:hypothetical protein
MSQWASGPNLRSTPGMVLRGPSFLAGILCKLQSINDLLGYVAVWNPGQYYCFFAPVPTTSAVFPFNNRNVTALV